MFSPDDAISAPDTFRQGGRHAAHDLRLEALPWDIDLKGIDVPVDIWHGLDDTIVRCKQADIASTPKQAIGGEPEFAVLKVHPTRRRRPTDQPKGMTGHERPKFKNAELARTRP